MVPYNETKKCTYFLSKLARNDQPSTKNLILTKSVKMAMVPRSNKSSAKNLILIAKSVKMTMVPSMVPYYYMQMRQKIRE